MAIFAKRDTVGNFIPKFRIFRPRLDVMRFKSAATFAALLASVVALNEYLFAPFFIFVPADLNKAFVFVALVSGVFIASLKVWCIAPSVRHRTAFDAVKCRLSLIRIFPLFNGGYSRLLAFFFGGISTLFRAINLFTTWGVSKHFATVGASAESGRSETLPRAVNTFAYICATWRSFKFFTASGAINRLLCLQVYAAQFIAAFTGAGSLFSVLQPLRVGLISFATNGTFFVNSLDHDFPLLSV